MIVAGVSVFLMAVAHGKIELVHLILQHLLNGGVSRMKLESTLSPLSLTILFRRNCVLNFLLIQLFNVNVTTNKTGRIIFYKWRANCGKNVKLSTPSCVSFMH